MGIFTEALNEQFHIPTTSRRRLRRPGSVRQKQNPAANTQEAKQKSRKSFKASIRASSTTPARADAKGTTVDEKTS